RMGLEREGETPVSGDPELLPVGNRSSSFRESNMPPIHDLAPATPSLEKSATKGRIGRQQAHDPALRLRLRARRSSVLLVLIALVAGCRGAATVTPPEYTVSQERPDRLIATLPNRMIIVAQRVPTTPVVSAQVWVKTGSLYEQEFVGAGLSHFLEHLLAGGTTE